MDIRTDRLVPRRYSASAFHLGCGLSFVFSLEHSAFFTPSAPYLRLDPASSSPSRFLTRDPPRGIRDLRPERNQSPSVSRALNAAFGTCYFAFARRCSFRRAREKNRNFPIVIQRAANTSRARLSRRRTHGFASSGTSREFREFRSGLPCICISRISIVRKHGTVSQGESVNHRSEKPQRRRRVAS